MPWIKAVCILAMIFVNWAALIIMFSAIHIASRLAALFSKNDWSYSVFLAEDCMVNAIMGGHFKTTISAEIGNMHRKGSATGTRVAAVVNMLFYFFTRDPVQKDHCRHAIEKEDVFVFNPLRAIIGTFLFQASVIALVMELIWLPM